MSNLNRGPSIHAFYQISVHLLKWFQKRRLFQKSTNQKKEWPLVAMLANGLELNEQSLQRTFQGCFLPSFDSFSQAVSEEKIFQKSANQKQEWHVVAMFVNGSGQNDHSLKRTLPQMLPTKFQFIQESGFRGEDFLEINHSKTGMACGGHVC